MSEFRSDGPSLPELDAYGCHADEYHQSTTACCPRETIPDSCSCLEGCECLCLDCDCGAAAAWPWGWGEEDT